MIIKVLLLKFVVVQAVMMILVLASVSSWYLIIRRSVALRSAERLQRGFLQRFRQGGDLAQLYREGQAQPLPDEAALQRIFLAGYGEFAQLQRQPGIAPDVVAQGVERSLYVAVCSAVLQARAVAEDILSKPPHSPTLNWIVPCVTCNRPEEDTELVCGLIQIDFRGDQPQRQDLGLGDDPSRYRLERKDGRMSLREDG